MIPPLNPTSGGPPSPTGSIQATLEDGLYEPRWYGYYSNGVPQIYISRSYIRKPASRLGSHMQGEHVAGARDSVIEAMVSSPAPLDTAHSVEILTHNGWAFGLSGGTLTMSFISADDVELKSEKTGNLLLWKFTLVTEDAGGKRVADFTSGLSDSPPPNPQVIFPVGTKAYYSQVTSVQDILAKSGGMYFVTRETELLDHWICNDNLSRNRQLRYKLSINGHLEVYIVEGTPRCEAPTADQGNTIGYGSWSRVNKQGFDGFELVFPVDKPYGAYQNTIDPAVFDKSGRLYILRTETSSMPYTLAITMPAGTVIKSKGVFFDKNVLPVLKQTLGLE